MVGQPFHAFTIKFKGVTNRIITNVTIFPPFRREDLEGDGPKPRGHEAPALWDTGATKSAISPRIAQALSLTPVGKTRVAHAGGIDEKPTHVVNIWLPNRVGVAGVLVSEFQGSDFEVLIGMDIIARGDLSLTHVNGKSCMSFRMPSVLEVDFVGEANRLTFAGAARNKPCPCGKRDANGKPVKFKHCHGRGGKVPA